MKKLRISVEDRVYDVTVEVLEDDDRPNGLAVHHRTTEPMTGNGSSFPAAKNGGNGTKSPDIINAPIAGTVQKVFVQPGGRVEAKAPVLLLDAMKMDTYIYAPRKGTIAAVEVHAGDAVRVGQKLMRYEGEA